MKRKSHPLPACDQDPRLELTEMSSAKNSITSKWRFPKWGYPQIFHFDGIFPLNQPVWGHPLWTSLNEQRLSILAQAQWSCREVSQPWSQRHHASFSRDDGRVEVCQIWKTWRCTETVFETGPKIDGTTPKSIKHYHTRISIVIFSFRLP